MCSAGFCAAKDLRAIEIESLKFFFQGKTIQIPSAEEYYLACEDFLL